MELGIKDVPGEIEAEGEEVAVMDASNPPELGEELNVTEFPLP